MSCKLRSSTSPSKATIAGKKTRQSISLNTKVDIVMRHEKGERLVDISRSLHLAPSSVRTILNSTDKIKAIAATAMPGTALRITKVRDSTMESMEHMLSLWIEDQTQRNAPPSWIKIREKAKSLWEALKTREAGGLGSEVSQETFKASHGWFERYKKRAHLHNLYTEEEVARVGSSPFDVNIVLIFN